MKNNKIYGLIMIISGIGCLIAHTIINLPHITKDNHWLFIAVVLFFSWYSTIGILKLFDNHDDNDNNDTERKDD